MLSELYIGNDKTKESLLASVKAGRLSHSILLSGEKGNGVNYLALLLACELLGVTSTKELYSHPAVRIMEGDTGVRREYSVGAMRELIGEMSNTSIDSESRIVILKNCERFNTSSANAFLKTLEEPRSDVYFILTTNDISSIIPTIRSRCSIYQVGDVSEEEAGEYLEEISRDDDIIENLIRIYGGNIGKSKRCLEDPARYALLKNSIDIYNLLLRGDAYEVAKAIYRYNRDKNSIAVILEDLTVLCSKKYTRKTVNVIDVIEKYRGLLQTNVNLNLMIECFASEAARAAAV